MQILEERSWGGASPQAPLPTRQEPVCGPPSGLMWPLREMGGTLRGWEELIMSSGTNKKTRFRTWCPAAPVRVRQPSHWSWREGKREKQGHSDVIHRDCLGLGFVGRCGAVRPGQATKAFSVYSQVSSSESQNRRGGASPG